MAWAISNTEGFVRITFSGTVCDQDLREIADAVETIETSGPIAPHRISNLTAAVGINLTFESILALVRWRRELPLSNRIKSAVITSEVLQFGFARMFHTLNDHPMVTVKLFENEGDAIAWVREK